MVELPIEAWWLKVQLLLTPLTLSRKNLYMIFNDFRNLHVGNVVREKLSGRLGKIVLLVVGRSFDESEIHVINDKKDHEFSIFPDEYSIVSSVTSDSM